MLEHSTGFLFILEHYKYWAIFPLAIVEGPIIAVISGLLVSFGLINLYVAYAVLVIADLIGDTFYYLLGRYWRSSERIKRYTKYFGYSEEKEKFLEEHFRKHKLMTFLIAKASHGIGWSALLSSGIAGVKYREFLFYTFLGTLPKMLIFVVIGYYVGSSYRQIDSYLGAIAVSVVIIAVSFIAYKLLKKENQRLLE